MFVFDKPFQPGPVLECKAGIYLLGKAERLSTDKHTSLLWTIVNYVRKKFYNIGPQVAKFLNEAQEAQNTQGPKL